MSVEYPSYDESHRPGVLTLMKDVWGAAADPDEFRWWFEESPAGEAIVTIALDGDRVVGVAAMAWLRLRIAGVESRIPFPQSVATHPSYRGQGIFQHLQRENERRASADGAELALTFPNAATAPIFLGSLGWTALRGPRIWVRPIKPVAFVQALVRHDVKTASSWPEGDGGARLGGIEVSRLRACPEDVAHLVPPGDRPVADEAYLRWRYFESPRRYRCFGAFEEGRLRGFAAIGPATLQRVSGMALTELLVAEGDVAAARALLSACSRETGRNFACMFAAEPGPGLRSAFVRSGFVPTPRRLRFLGKRISGVGSLPSTLSFTLGDLDFV